MKKLIAIVLLLSSGYAAAAEFSGNVTLATDYRFRGISQGDRSPAIQGGFDLETESGFYVGTWASNVGFTEGSIELDVYAGFSKDLSDDTAFDVGVLYYGYPHQYPYGSSSTGLGDANYVEVYGSFSFYGATVVLNYSPDYFGESDQFFYLYGDYSLPIGDNFSLDFHLGLNQFKDEEAAGLDFGIGTCVTAGLATSCSDDNYLDWSLGVSTSAVGLDFSLAYVATNLDDGDCFGGSKACEDTGVFSISKSL
jgi:uncharacterized protein (TIGR02001 family)